METFCSRSSLTTRAALVIHQHLLIVSNLNRFGLVGHSQKCSAGECPAVHESHAEKKMICKTETSQNTKKLFSSSCSKRFTLGSRRASEKGNSRLLRRMNGIINVVSDWETVLKHDRGERCWPIPMIYASRHATCKSLESIVELPAESNIYLTDVKNIELEKWNLVKIQ